MLLYLVWCVSFFFFGIIERGAEGTDIEPIGDSPSAARRSRGWPAIVK